MTYGKIFLRRGDKDTIETTSVMQIPLYLGNMFATFSLVATLVLMLVRLIYKRKTVDTHQKIWNRYNLISYGLSKIIGGPYYPKEGLDKRRTKSPLIAVNRHQPACPRLCCPECHPQGNPLGESATMHARPGD